MKTTSSMSTTMHSKWSNGIYKFEILFLSHIEQNSIFNFKKIDGSIINHDMKIEMLFHIIQHYYYYGEPI